MQNRLDLGGQRREVIRYDVPEDVEVHCIVAMDEAVARTDDFPLGKLWMSYLHGSGNTGG